MKIRASVLKLTVLANLSALAIVGRIQLSMVAGFQPVTIILILIALFMDLPSALAVTVITVLITNIFLGSGIWTLYQIISWGTICLLSLLFRRWRQKIVVIAIWSLAAGIAYGAIISIFTFQFLGAAGGYWAYWVAGLPHDLNHAIGNFVLCWAIYPIFRYLIHKFGLERTLR